MELSMPDFLREAQEELTLEEDALLKLRELVTEFQLQEGRIEDLELDLKEQKERMRQIGQVAIPNLMLQHGLSEVRLKSGKKVIVKEQVSVSVPTVKEEAFFKFLKERHEEDIVKLHFHFDRMPEEQMKALFEFLTEREYAYDSDRGVHPQTLKKYFKELLGVGDENQSVGIAEGKYMRKEELEQIANVFTFFDTKIK
jgi:hypothetical protein